jgi:hypothetical protein
MKVPKILAASTMLAALALFVGSIFTVFTVDTLAQTTEICDNKVDDDKDGLIDGDDPDCQKKPPTEGCSPGFYKNHPEIWVGICCDTGLEGSLVCADLNAGLTPPCRGGTCAAAAAILDACTGCTE